MAEEVGSVTAAGGYSGAKAGESASREVELGSGEGQESHDYG